MIFALVKAVTSASTTLTTLTTLTTQSERDLVSGDFCSSRGSGQYNIFEAEGSGAGIIFMAAREEFSQIRSTPYCSRCLFYARDIELHSFLAQDSNPRPASARRVFSSQLSGRGPSCARVYGIAAALWNKLNFSIHVRPARQIS